MNSAKGSTGNVAGVLLYAKTDEVVTPDEKDMFISGNRITLKTLDLNSDWVEITDQLESLCEWLMCAQTGMDVHISTPKVISMKRKRK